MTAAVPPAPTTSTLSWLKPYLALLGAMLSVAIGTSFAKSLFPAVGAEGTSALRVGLGAMILAAVWRPWRFALNRQAGRAIVLYGLMMGAMNLSFYLALKTIPLGVAIAIEFAGPLTLALTHARRWIHGLWIAMAAVGLALLLPIRGLSSGLDPVGVGFAAAAGLFWALYIVCGKRLGGTHPGQSVALGMAVAALLVVPVGLFHAGEALFHPGLLVAGLAVAAASSALPFSLEMIALRAIPKRTFGVLVSAEPVIGALAGLIVLHEHLNAQQWVAMGAIVTASAGAIVTTRSAGEAS